MNMIQSLPNNEYFVLGLIALFAILWIKHPKKVFWQTEWWGRHISGNHDDHQHPACFMCNLDGSDCNKTLACKKLREQLNVDINGDPLH